MEKPYLTSNGLANRWEMSSYTIRRWRVYGKGPMFHKMGGSVRYYVEDVEEYEKTIRKQHTSEPTKTAFNRGNSIG